MEHGGHDLGLDRLCELVEHDEGLVLVLDQGVALAIAAQADPLLEMLHVGQVVDPLGVDRLQHHKALDAPHQVGRQLLLLGVVSFHRGPVEELDQSRPSLLQGFGRDHGARRQREVEREVLEQVLEVPVLRMPALAVGLYSLLDQLTDVGLDVAAGVGAGEDLVPLVVNDRPLGVHHVVVLDQVLAGVEVHPLDLLLRALDRTRHPLVLDGLDLELVHQPADAVRRRAEDTHEVVLERDEEAAGAGIALAAGAAAQLVVDAA